MSLSDLITAEEFNLSPDRYELHRGALSDAPPCPFGNRFKWIGFDKVEMKYIRVTKSVFKRLIKGLDRKFVERHEEVFNQSRDNN